MADISGVTPVLSVCPWRSFYGRSGVKSRLTARSPVRRRNVCPELIPFQRKELDLNVFAGIYLSSTRGSDLPDPSLSGKTQQWFICGLAW